MTITYLKDPVLEGATLALLIYLQYLVYPILSSRWRGWWKKKKFQFRVGPFLSSFVPRSLSLGAPWTSRSSFKSYVKPSGKAKPVRNPIRHHQFGIYRRLREVYDLYPRRRSRTKQPYVGSRGTGRVPAHANREPAAWEEYVYPHAGSYFQGIPTTISYITVAYGVSSQSVDQLLELVDPVWSFDAERSLLRLFSPTPESLVQAHIATATRSEDLHVRYEPEPGGARAYLADGRSRCDVPIVFDTGCSFSVTPFMDDFVTPLRKADVSQLNGLTDIVKIEGIGTVEWTVRDVFGQVAMLRQEAYYCPDADIRLEAPTSYFIEHEAGYCHADSRRLLFVTAEGQKLVFPYHPKSNLPLMFLDHNVCSGGPSAPELMLGRALSGDVVLQEQVQTLLNDNNHNLSGPQKELLLWHYRLAHAGQLWVQDLMQKVKHEVGDTCAPIIQVKHATTPRCPMPKCPACQLGKQHKKTPDSSKTVLNPDKEMAIRRNNLNPGDCVSMDQYVCRTQGRLPNTYGREKSADKYNGGTIFVDHSSQFIWINHQVSLRVGDTLRGKHDLETYAQEYGIKIKTFRADNQPFAAQEFAEDLRLQGQTINYSGVGAHHENGVAERAIKTITTWSRSMMMHLLIHWPDEYRSDLWPFAMNQAVFIWNHLPKNRHGLSPHELFTRVKSPSHDLIRSCRVWGSPVYVLDATLQDGNRLPKWKKRSRLGMYLGCSSNHSSTVGLILSLDTGFISPQCHMVWDELFASVFGNLTDEVFNAEEWNNLISFNGIQNLLNPSDVVDGKEPRPELFDQFVNDAEDASELASSSPTADPVSSAPEGDDAASTTTPGDAPEDGPSATEDRPEEATSTPTTTSNANEGAPRKRGRPPKKKRGRPPKARQQDATPLASVQENEGAPPKRKRGRPPKSEPSPSQANEGAVKPRPRGRPVQGKQRRSP